MVEILSILNYFGYSCQIDSAASSLAQLSNKVGIAQSSPFSTVSLLVDRVWLTFDYFSFKKNVIDTAKI